MNIKNIEVSKINPATYNPRLDLKPDDEEYEKLKRSINEFGYVEPLVWNEETGNLVGGHQRFKILLENNPTKIMVSVVNLDLEREKVLNIALNKISGDWDEVKLAEVLADLQEVNFDLDLTGFNEEDIAEILQDETLFSDMEAVEEDEFRFKQTVDELRNKEPETQLGDIWKLGPHTLVCGDATKREDVEKLLSGRKADLVVTDPPYNVAVHSDSKKLQTEGADEILNDDLSEEEFDAFLNKVFESYQYAMEDKAAIYVFHPSSFQRQFENSMNKANIVVRSQCIWVKNAPSFGWSQYRFQHEPVFYAFKKGKSPSWYGDRKQTTVWRESLTNDLPESVWEVSRGDTSKYIHPTQKPLELLAIPIENSSKEGDFVLDLFGGSGSTLMTCEQMKRVCGLLELDPYFCDAIKLRYEQSTGIKPELVHREK